MAQEESEYGRIEIYTDALKNLPTKVYERVVEYEYGDGALLIVLDNEDKVIWPFSSVSHVTISGLADEDDE